ncbi:MAG: plasmid stability protein [Acidobacteria bacterium]|nr:plasmid stability protein [Acidobacteriota bacterium]
MPNLTVRNLSEEVHRALRMRAARHGRSTEAEVRLILEDTVRPPKRLKIGSEIHRIAREVGGMDELDVSRRRTAIRGEDFT